MLRVEVDTSTFPLVVQRIRFGHTDQDMASALARFLPLFARRQRYAVVITHEPGVQPGGASMRKLIAEFMTEHAESMRRCNVCFGIVLQSVAHRAAMSGVNWLFPPVTPHKACSSILEAVEYCTGMLSAEGIALTPSILRLREELRTRTGYETPSLQGEK